MPKTSGERNTTQITTSILLDDRAFIEELMKVRGHDSLGDAFRDVFHQLRTCFSLPPFMAERVQRDMEERGLDILGYTADLFGRRFQELASTDQEQGRGKAGGRRQS